MWARVGATSALARATRETGRGATTKGSRQWRFVTYRTTDGLPACEVDTAEELTQRLVPGVYVRASRDVLAACGWGDTENADTAEIVAGADWRDDAWIAEGGE